MDTGEGWAAWASMCREQGRHCLVAQAVFQAVRLMSCVTSSQALALSEPLWKGQRGGREHPKRVCLARAAVPSLAAMAFMNGGQCGRCTWAGGTDTSGLAVWSRHP